MAVDTHYIERTEAVLGDAFEIVSEEEGWAMLDNTARLYLDMSGEEFLSRYDSGELASEADNPKIILVEMLIPFARP